MIKRQFHRMLSKGIHKYGSKLDFTDLAYAETCPEWKVPSS